ncbi:hypothetical protein ACTACU_08685 [Pseudomonas syringae]|uniref:hypothetical protein n=1 Tax=Pseudomonas syringae TaxID=317 RepID=UPI003F8419FB
METTYWLRQAIIGPQNLIKLTQSEFEEIFNARTTLVDAKDFEERYEMLLGNFIDIEKFFSNYALESQLGFTYEYKNISETFMDANRRAMNFLTTFKSYLDQTPQDFKQSYLPFKEKFSHFTRRAYDRSKAYRFISALRNHVQHYSPPVHRIKGGKNSGTWPTPVKFICEPKYLLDNANFKRAALEEFSDEIDLQEQIRDFMKEMSDIHISLRSEIEPYTKRAREIFEHTISRFKAAQHEEHASALGLTICEQKDEKYVSTYSVMLDWDDTRLYLVKKNAYILRTTNKNRKAPTS